MRSRKLTRRSVMTGFVGISFVLPVLAQTQPAHQVPRRYPRGANFPTGLLDQIKSRNKVVEAINQTLKLDADLVKSIGEDNSLFKGPAASLATSYMAPMTPVKDQLFCGSCWVFAAAGAFEGAYLKMNNKTIAVSTQQMLDCSFPWNSCKDGGYHEICFVALTSHGIVESGKYDGIDDYKGVKNSCDLTVSSPVFKSHNWGYVRDAGMRDDSLIPWDVALKQAILRYGPIVCGVFTDEPTDNGTRSYPQFMAWDEYQKINPDGSPCMTWSEFGPSKVFPGIPSEKLKKDQSEHDHQVLLVGWDDNLVWDGTVAWDATLAKHHGCWIIKNSWGMNWGDEGYMRLPYGCNNVGLAASWIYVMPDNALVSENLVHRLDDIEQGYFGMFYTNMNIFQ
jgi:hypothetical protein